MNDGDREDFYRAWASAWEACGKTVTDRMLRFAFEVLRKYPLDSVRGAILRHAADTEAGQYAPKPADIIRQIEGGGDERSLKAWTKLEGGISRVGPWRRMAFDDARIHAVVGDMGGMQVLCSAQEKDWPFLRNEFCRRYVGYIQNPPTSYEPWLVGEPNADTNGQIYLVGDTDAAAEVLRLGRPGSALKIGTVSEVMNRLMPMLEGPR